MLLISINKKCFYSKKKRKVKMNIQFHFFLCSILFNSWKIVHTVKMKLSLYEKKIERSEMSNKAIYIDIIAQLSGCYKMEYSRRLVRHTFPLFFFCLTDVFHPSNGLDSMSCIMSLSNFFFIEKCSFSFYSSIIYDYSPTL